MSPRDLREPLPPRLCSVLPARSYNESCSPDPTEQGGPKTCCTLDDIPLISKCGSYPPESCLFSLIGNLGAFMGELCPRRPITTPPSPPTLTSTPQEALALCSPPHQGLRPAGPLHFHSMKAQG